MFPLLVEWCFLDFFPLGLAFSHSLDQSQMQPGLLGSRRLLGVSFGWIWINESYKVFRVSMWSSLVYSRWQSRSGWHDLRPHPSSTLAGCSSCEPVASVISTQWWSMMSEPVITKCLVRLSPFLLRGSYCLSSWCWYLLLIPVTFSDISVSCS